MTRNTSRRAFLGQTALLSTAALWTAGSPVRAIEPIQRKGKPKFKFSLAAYSYRKLLQGKNAELSLADFIDDCAAMQLEGTELTSYYFPEEVTPEYLRGLRQHCFRQGLDVSGTAIRNDFCYPAGDQRDAEIAHCKKWIEYAAMLGAPVIRIFAGKVRPGVSEEESHRLMIAGMEECCDYAGQHGVHLALENHGGPTATVEGLLSLARDVKSPWFGINLDTGNFHSDDIYGDLAQAAPYALNVQVKVVVAGPDKKKQPADFARLARMMRDVGYRGYIVLEYEESDDPRAACPSYMEQLRAAFLDAAS